MSVQKALSQVPMIFCAAYALVLSVILSFFVSGTIWASAKSADFEEFVAVDNDYCVIRITDMEEDDLYGYTLDVYLENKTEDTLCMFSVSDAAVNGVALDPYFATKVESGKKATDTITFYAMKNYDIGDITDIELSFRVYDYDDWSADDLVNVTFHLYPAGEENAVHYEREAQDTDIVLVDNEYVTVIITDFEESEKSGFTANLFLVNRTDLTLMYSVDDVSVNNYMLDPYWAKSISGQKCAFSSMSWSASRLETIDVTEVEEIEFTLQIYDYDDWSADDLVNEVFTVNP